MVQSVGVEGLIVGDAEGEERVFSSEVLDLHNPLAVGARERNIP